MIFGYYHITMRSFSQKELPEIELPPNTEIAEKVRVGHLMFLPIFPIKRLWVYEKGGNSYMAPHSVYRIVERKFGQSNDPWYSFFGLILFGAIFIFIFLGSIIKDNTKKNELQSNIIDRAERFTDHINNPDTSHIYILNYDYKKIAINVNRHDADSIYFYAPVDNNKKKWGDENWAFGYYKGNNPMQNIAFAKTDLLGAFPRFNNKVQKPIKVNPRLLPTDGKSFTIRDIILVDESKPVPFLDKNIEARVVSDLNHFLLNHNKIDSLMSMIDAESIEFYKNILLQSTKPEDELRTILTKDYKNNPLIYELALMTKYVYLDENDKAKSQKRLSQAKKKLSDYIFFLKLFNRGFLSIEDLHASVKINGVTLDSDSVATVKLIKVSDLLDKREQIAFDINMSKAEERWKVNLVSAYSYNLNQIYRTRGNGSVEYRKLVRKQILSFEEDIVIDPYFNY